MKKTIRKDNRGIAIVTILVALTICVLLATVALEITYNSILARNVYRVANNNVYSSETPLSDMETVLQSLAVYTASKMKPDEDFITKVSNNITESSGMRDDTDFNAVARYFYNNMDIENKRLFSKKVLDDTTGEYVIPKNDDDTEKLELDTNLLKVTGITKATETEGVSSTKKSLAISVQMSYLDENGYMSTISSDLVLNDIVRRKTASDYPLGSYSMFTGGGATFTGEGLTIDKNYNTDSRLSYFRQDGNAYIGMKVDAAPTALDICSHASAEFTGGVIVNGDVYVTDYSSLLFSGGEGVEVSIYGDLYIDPSSVVTINEGVNFMVKDIKVMDSSGNWVSYFGKEDGPTLLAKDGEGKPSITGIYSPMFPYDATSTDDLRTKYNNNTAKFERDWIGDNAGNASKIGGAVLISDGSKSYVSLCLPKDGTYEWKGISGKTFSKALISKNPTFVPVALQTIRTLDNQAVLVDSELTKFVNTELLYFDYKNGQEGGFANQGNKISYNISKLINDGTLKFETPATMGDTSATIDFGGKSTADYKYFYAEMPQADGSTSWVRLTPDQLTEICTEKNDSDVVVKEGRSKFALPETYLSPKKNAEGEIERNESDEIIYENNKIEYAGYAIKDMDIKIGLASPEGENLHSNQYSVLLGCIWDKFTVQKNGGDVVGIAISAASECLYKVQGRGYIAFKSIVNAKTTKDPITGKVTEPEDMDAVIDYMKTITCADDDNYTQFNDKSTNKNYYNDSVALLSLDNLFVGGLDSLKSGKTSSTGGSVYLESASMYDFITIENWTQQ